MCVLKCINKFWTGDEKDFFIVIFKFGFLIKQLRVERLQNIEIK